MIELEFDLMMMSVWIVQVMIVVDIELVNDMLVALSWGIVDHMIIHHNLFVVIDQ